MKKLLFVVALFIASTTFAQKETNLRHQPTKKPETAVNKLLEKKRVKATAEDKKRVREKIEALKANHAKKEGE